MLKQNSVPRNPVLKNHHLDIVIHSRALAQFYSPQVISSEVTKALSSCCLGGDLAHAKSLHKDNSKLFSSGLRPFIAKRASAQNSLKLTCSTALRPHFWKEIFEGGMQVLACASSVPVSRETGSRKLAGIKWRLKNGTSTRICKPKQRR